MIILKYVLTILLASTICTASDQSKDSNVQHEWKLIRSVANPYGGTIDFVLVREAKQRDLNFLEQIANKVCGERSSCMVQYWTDVKHIPDSAAEPVEDLAVMVSTYERSPSYEKPVVRLACWLYESKAEAERANCFYMPGAKQPPKP